ncbi:Uncharacterised protein [uncultured Clostridium sp.]|nr:Uncharacterised protein [uncultured Clostridium sp.]SCI96214.1 Uncharacterised protein [uncultured Clostridium sp.]
MLTKEEFNILLKKAKVFEDNSPIVLPNNGGKITRNLKSSSSNDEFILNIDRRKIDLSKIKYQTRHSRTNSIMLRIDTKGPRHQNPDGEYIECPHMHIYRENWGDKWAFPLDPNIFSNVSNLSNLLKEFLIYFNVQDIPNILYMESLV